MGLVSTAVRALVAYGVLLALMRATGKRTLTQASPFAFVLALILGDMVDDLLSAEVGLAQFTVACATLALLDTLLAVAQSRSARLQGWLAGQPLVFLREGRVDRAALRRERLREGDLEGLLRLRGMERQRWRDVRSAQLEPNGALSVIRTEAAQDVERRHLAGTRS